MGDVFDMERISVAFTEAAVDASRWDAAMDVVSEATGGFGAALFPMRGRLPNVPHSRSMATSFEAYIRDGWVHRDERYRGLPVMTRRGVVTDLDFMTADEIARHPYYQEFLAPLKLRWFAGVKVASGDDLWCLSLQRTIAQGPFSWAEQAQLAGLSARLASAAALARALGFARAEAALAAFEVSGLAVALLDGFGEVLKVNGAGERLLGTDVRILRRRIVSRDHDATAALDHALHAVLWNRTSAALMPPVTLPRAEKRPLLAYPMRLSAVSADALVACQALIVLVDLDRRPLPPEAALRSCFGLTTAEAKLALRFASGDALEHIADELGIAYETSRNHLKSIFAKMDVHRQAELVAVLARLLDGRAKR